MLQLQLNGRQRSKLLHTDCESSVKSSKLSPQTLILMQACPFPKLALIHIQSVHGFKPACVNTNVVFTSVTMVSEHMYPCLSCIAVTRWARTYLRASVLATVIKRQHRTENARGKNGTGHIEMTKPLVRPSKGPHERYQG